VLRRSRWHVVLEQRVNGTHTHEARHAQWVACARGRLHTGHPRRSSSYRLHWTAGGPKGEVTLRVRVVAGGRTIATSHPRNVRLHVAAPRRGAPPTPTPPTPVPTTTTPTTPPPATSIVVDTAHPGSAINPAVFGSDYLAPFGGMGSFDAASGAFWPSFTTQLTSGVGAGSLRFPGGITGQSYQWMRAIGPESQRSDNPVGPSGGPSPSTVGPDEFGSLLDLTGAVGVVDVDFAIGTAAEAADLVHYLTDPQGSSTWAQERDANGHPAPYDVPYWEVGNEELTPDYWRSGTTVSAGTPPADANACPTVATCEYIYGGTSAFTDRRVVLAADRRSSAAVSTGGAHQSFQVAYPPVVSGSATVMVGGTAWNPVSSLSTAGSSAEDYTLDPSTGTITFGDDVNGAIPPSGAVVTASYQSGPHDGFAQFYSAMKQANPAIQVCSSDTTQNFIDAMGTTESYDCLQDHPYVGSGNISPSLPIDQYESQVMTVPDVENAAVQTLQTEVDEAAGHHVPLVLSEYGQLIDSTPDPLSAPYFLSSLDEALLNASQLADWIKLGIPVADRQLLDAELPAPSAVTAGLPGAAPFATSGAITTPGPQTVVQPTGEYLALMMPLAGGNLLPATVSADPTIPSSTATTSGDLAVVSAATPSGVRLVVINRSPSVDVSSAVQFAGVTGSGTAMVITLDGPSPLSDNSGQAPHTVSTATSAAAVSDGTATITFPAHSISLVTVPGF
jgi:alpha-N-arabinofuranosidase